MTIYERIYVKSVRISTKLSVSLSKIVRFSIINLRWKAKNEPYPKSMGELIRAGALIGDNTVLN